MVGFYEITWEKKCLRGTLDAMEGSKTFNLRIGGNLVMIMNYVQWVLEFFKQNSIEDGLYIGREENSGDRDTRWKD